MSLKTFSALEEDKDDDILTKEEEERIAPISAFITSLVGKQVKVRLQDNSLYIGNFICVDGKMNIVLDKAEFYDAETNQNEVFSTVFVRGSTISYIEELVSEDPIDFTLPQTGL
ncbi:hypothetical protein ADUPG1_008093 [Aduncisulcus paluster]|uniref:Sm domain-containing protein n=1 Tax=Aduncisulcus paluster TaxID=2918883 RepID=A0ABQ5KQP9_9EUKA|nr:hypothetical protein ADUPG1_008093 [Aduncisulcus paluster]